MIDLVVARYNENIDWLSEIDYQFNKIFIYNKGRKLISNLPIYDIPNIGREADTYLTYIIDNYDNLSDFVVFLQGNPFDHTPNILNIINKLPHIEIINPNFKEIIPLGKIWTNNFGKITTITKYRGYSGIKQVFEIFYGVGITPKIFTASWGAQYIIKKELIYKYSLQQYKDVKLFAGNFHLPWAMELYWLYFFLRTKDDLLKDNLLKIY